ncbi:MAG: hypothetical protein Q8K65_12145 [Alphaproteobacteria bacterium]|nr:hypothetical protein [Alphaproteobacteria bacterium]
MRKLIGGKYVPVTDAPQKKAVAKAPAATAGPAAQSGAAGKPAAVKVDVSKAALTLMAQQPAGFDWSGMTGSGAGGQVTVGDVRAFLQAKK